MVSSARTKREKRKTSPGRKHLKAAFAVVLLLLATAWAISPLTVRVNQEHRLAALSRKKTRVERENRQLRNEIGKLKADPAHWEALARRDMGYVKRNEEAYVVIERESSVTPPPKREPPPTLWERLKSRINQISVVF